MADSQPPPQHNGLEQLPPSEDNIKTEPDLDASIEQDVEMNPEQPEEAPALDTDSILRNRHTKILHRQDSATLSGPSRASTTKPRPLNTEVSTGLVLITTGSGRRTGWGT